MGAMIAARVFCLLFGILHIVTSQRKPSFANYSGDARNNYALWLLNGAPDTKVEFPGYDGWYNNLARPDSGAIDKPLLRRSPAAYEDGTYLPAGSDRPNPFELSDKLLSGPIGSQSKTGKNALLVFFGQQVVEEILDAQRPACPPEYFNIKIPEYHRYRNLSKHTEMPLLRTRFDQRTGLNPNNPRQQLNEITPYIDGGLMYGISKQWADQLRTYSNGTIDPDGMLASSHDGLFPEYNTHRLPLANPPPPFHHKEFIENHEIFNVSRFFKLGNPRGNENTFLLTFGILWFRWHNYLAKSIRGLHRDWPSEKVFNEARKWVIATQQHIIMDEWLPSWIDPSHIPAYRSYDASIDPQIDQFFQAAAFRFGHTLVTPGVYIRDYQRSNCATTISKPVRTCNAFWRPQDAIQKRIGNLYVDIDRVLMGMAMQMCEKEDHKIVEDLRGNVFGPLEFPRRDLMAINIQRGREHGLPDFNSARKAYNLPRVDSVDHFPDDVNQTIKDELMRLYQNNFDNIDTWVGGILETRDGPGELFEAIIIDQFRRIRDGDRFWYENLANGLFTRDEVTRIKSITLYDIIMTVTMLDSNDIQTNVFRVPTSNEPFAICRLQQSNCTERGRTMPCFHLPILNEAVLNETCLQGSTYDYFSNSEASFILTFTIVSAIIAGLIGAIYTMVYFKQKSVESLSSITPAASVIQDGIVSKEMINKRGATRLVIVNITGTHINVLSGNGVRLRKLDCKNGVTCISTIDKPYIVIKPRNEYDLVLTFESHNIQFHAYNKITQSLRGSSCTVNEEANRTFKSLLPTLVSKKQRQKQLEVFCRVVFAQAFKLPHNKKELLSTDSKIADIMKMELTLEEFSNLLNMRSDSQFVNLMFKLIDVDLNGFVSFGEFLNLMVIFSEGTTVDKARLLFDMYDIEQIKSLPIEAFKDMILSFMENVTGNIKNEDLKVTIDSLMKQANLQNKTALDFQDFMRVIGEDGVQHLENVNLQFKYGSTNMQQIENSRQHIIEDIYGTIGSNSAPQENVANNLSDNRALTDMTKMFAFVKDIEKNSTVIFWKFLYTLILLSIFAERAYYYSVEREHSGLRRIAGYGVTVTRGAASAMMFTYSSLLVTMCRNLITILRDTALHQYFPFDASVDFHKYIAYWAFVFTIMHIVGHAFNFYHISTQTADDLTCLFRNYFHATHEIPKFHYWCWQTMTGFTGIVLTIIAGIIYVFALPIARSKLYNVFWISHSIYPLFYIFLILHGSGRLIQEPFTHYFLLGPIILFTLDQIISISRKKIEFLVEEAKILPSNVTMLKIHKPTQFSYKSGQWVRIACLELNRHEYHPFTLSSSPDEPFLSVHIRAVGPWTRHIRTLYDEAVQYNKPLPTLFIDGPFGEGHQDWYKYEVSVLIGGGIGVTPFASILKDILFKASINQQVPSKKVYFLWVSKTQKQFEWLIDLLREVEKRDVNKIISNHIYVTQFYEKFDLRTIMLFIFERHFKRITNKSLFTNLNADTHFGRPVFKDFFRRVIMHNTFDINKIGIFSCGSPTMVNAVEEACIENNKSDEQIILEHHYQTF
ncbi:PREDICTED: dual oxidase-like [Nicrophorus vespilloides]|uniref:NAD(P)H oxidase (H2O2-forming) n=1 Tax=Nicrophorus vespilloides TaxID=110193 RepID=A0ABM1LZX8_NICVS|nr:PREDICTED: dual oxidase-like [Nicrophorus vespilloides]